MKQLYESILKSTRSGKDAVIIDWMKENLAILENPRSPVKRYENTKNNFFIKDSKICTVPDYKGWIYLLRSLKGGNIELPDYIKFGECPKASFLVNADRIKPDQYPEKCYEIWVVTSENRIKNLKLNADKKVALVSSTDKFGSLEFKNIEIKTGTSDFTLKIYGFLTSPDDIKDIKIDSKPGTKITLEFGGDSIYAFKKDYNKKDKKEINEFCNSFIKNIKGLNRIDFGSSTSSVVFEKSSNGDWERKKY